METVMEFVKVGANALIGALVGACGIAYFMRSYIEKRLNKKEAEESKKKANRIARAKLQDELQHRQGRFNFWIHHAIVKGEHNGDLEDAFKNYTDTEEKIKEFNRQLIAEEGED